MSEPATKFCRDCVHSEPSYFLGWSVAKCRALPDAVTGKAGRYCSIERDAFYDGISSCGSKGKLWEPRPQRWWRFWVRKATQDGQR